MEELKSCPFCGESTDDIKIIEHEGSFNQPQKYSYVHCTICGASSGKMNASVDRNEANKRAAEAWNTRCNIWVDFRERKPAYGDMVIIILPPEQCKMPRVEVYTWETEWVDGSIWMPFPEPPKENRL